MFIIYGKPNCDFCTKAVDLLRSYNENMIYLDITQPEHTHILNALTKLGITTVPQVYQNDHHIGGCDDLFAFLTLRHPVQQYTRTVIKRDGRVENLNPSKINSMVEWAVHADLNVQWSEIVMDAMEKLGSAQLTSDNIQSALIKSCLDKDTESHNKVAGRLLLGDLRKKIKFGKDDFTEFYRYMVLNKFWIDMELSNWELCQAEKAINSNQDLKYGYPTLRQFSDKYAIRDHDGQLLEHPQFMYMGIALARFKNYSMGRVISYYNKISTHKISLPSPQLSTTRTPSNGGVSCVVITGGDTLQGIESAKHIAFLATAASAGIGIEMDVRSPGDDVRNGYAKAGGKLPHYRTLSAVVKEVKQSNRGGSATVTFTCFDPEVRNLLKLKLPRTPDDRKIDKLDYSFAVNSSFLRRAAKRQDWALVSRVDSPELHEAFYMADSELFDTIMDDVLANPLIKKQVVNAFDILDQFLESRQEIGRYYETNINHMNSHTPFNPAITPIRQSNLCLEIALPTKAYGHITELYKKEYDEGDGMTALCFISALDVMNISTDEEYEDCAYYTLLALDDLMSNMDYPTPQIKAVAQAWRSAGVGMTNLAQKIASEGKSYKDLDYIHQISERHYYFLMKASVRLAKERGSFDWISKTKWADGWCPLHTYNSNVDGLASDCMYDWDTLIAESLLHGVRFSVLAAHMPCESSSGMTNSTNSLYPIRNDVVYKDSKGGDIQFFAPNYDSYKYETVWDLTFNDMANVYAIVQKFTDQAISADTFVDFSKYDNKQIPKSERTKNYLYWNKLGIKTMYYQNPKTGRGEVAAEPECVECDI
jgi:ribonucleoside-diphosphate reductase alpha subunit